MWRPQAKISFMSWDVWESADVLPDILNRAHWLQASVDWHNRAAASWGKNPPVHGMWEVGWDTVEGRRESSCPCVKLNLDSLVICSMHRPLHWLNYRGSHINDKSKTLAKFSVLDCKREHFVSGILQTVSKMRSSHGDRSYVFVMGYLQFRACRPLYLTTVTIEQDACSCVPAGRCIWLQSLSNKLRAGACLQSTVIYYKHYELTCDVTHFLETPPLFSHFEPWTL